MQRANVMMRACHGMFVAAGQRKILCNGNGRIQNVDDTLQRNVRVVLDVVAPSVQDISGMASGNVIGEEVIEQ
jgi:hypothetical protein